MHRISTTPGDWNPQIDGVVLFAQTPAPLVLLTATDTDIQTLAAAATKLPMGFPTFRVANLLQLQQQIVIDTYAEDVLEKAQVIILRLLGGRSYWSYGLEVVRETARRTGAALIVIPGDDAIDPDLIAHSTVPLAVGDRLWRYFLEGGVENAVNALLFTADFCLHTSYNPQPPQVVPRVGLYGWKGVGEKRAEEAQGAEEAEGEKQPSTSYQLPATNYQLPITNYQLPKIGILFYRAHYLAGNTGVIDDLCQALVARNLLPVPVFVSSLRDPQVQADVLSYFQPKDEAKIQVLLNTTSFSLTRIFPTPERQFARAGENEQATGSSRLPTAANLWQQLDIPILQVIFSSSSISTWETSSQGLSPRDIGMNVALPEVDGRIISRAVSFKAVQSWNTALETNVVVYESVRDRLEFVAELTQRWVQLRSRPPAARKIALILANYPNRDGRLANGVGLDTPASCIEILKSLQQAGYQVENLPQTGDELIQRLTSGVTNDPDSQWRSHPQQLSWQEYQQYFATLPEAAQQEIVNRWEKRAEGAEGVTTNYQLPTTNCQLPIPGIQLGNVFVGIQPARGYDRDPALNYHAPDLEPPHTYLAFYYWLRQHFGADAIVHVGKHGNLEWLPGKSVALSSQCYPEIALGAMPHFYPFIVNDPGEGSQAKRRAQAVIIDHLTPPMTRAELYGALHQLESLVDEYYEAQSLDPTRLPAISDRIWQLIVQENLHLDLGMKRESGGKRAEGAEGEKQPTTNNQQPLTINQLDGYLCELKEAQIRDGLHIFGQCPQGEQLRDLIVAIARQPNSYQPGITRAIAQAWELDFDPLTTDFSTQLSETSARILSAKTQTPCHIIGDAIEVLEQYAAELVEVLIGESGVGSRESEKRAALELGRLSGAEGEKTQLPITNYPLPITNTLNWIRDRLLPALAQTPQEITNLLRGLDGRYVPSGASGAPTRGRPEVLPTGKNFYSVDIRAIPTETAWDIGRKAAEALIERYTQENGEYPKTLGLSIWGTSTMRTGGDDIAEALALLGVRPVWDGVSRRVVDFEIVPLSVLARPRVDVTLRISGFFRDAFPNLIDLFDSAVIAVSQLDEPAEQNPLAAKVKHETQFWYSAGLTPEQAKERSLYRVFGSKPGAYGAGLQGLIEAQNWTGDRDLAHAYINWSCYAYSRNSEGRAAPEAFEQRLGEMQIVLHNQDNREHDLLDSDDYYQFQGGLTVAVRAVRGKNPQTYFGDNSIPANPRIRDLKEEIAKVYRSRVVNPKWIAGVMRHGYKGAFEMAATVDYLFAYDATAHCVEDYMYQGIAEAYLFDPAIQDFVQQKNPWALRDMAERLIEAKQRGLWQVTPEIIDKLRAIAHQAEGAIEEN
ncbi:MAG: Aerobic cobaltochelatase subunit CobN [Chroococcidiopsis cubana SAG 39.79]|uniref:Cobaltochelatase subunit CobN n=2 Tax=Chroococcidiopsis TaxID=54298 RepID=A0AB37UG65_9CYAN|nr:cobaltochelatase subunit CobN [Chroococcidiopsis cubana]MDZ4873028.1 Aerobic cobaltochelatase subunit CobN [Chroococcidiopsis cubana SAG 39.79]RUT09477.1 cobaltochelatase subunit CobN [Chroococcidiopsis cubana SAG 39.79]